jgi:hypothetical protein
MKQIDARRTGLELCIGGDRWDNGRGMVGLGSSFGGFSTAMEVVKVYREEYRSSIQQQQGLFRRIQHNYGSCKAVSRGVS